jgi:hypothetical protein
MTIAKNIRNTQYHQRSEITNTRRNGGPTEDLYPYVLRVVRRIRQADGVQAPNKPNCDLVELAKRVARTIEGPDCRDRLAAEATQFVGSTLTTTVPPLTH